MTEKEEITDSSKSESSKEGFQSSVSPQRGDQVESFSERPRGGEEATDEDVSSRVLTLRVKTLDRKSVPVQVTSGLLVSNLKSIIAPLLQLEDQSMRLVAMGRVWENEKPLSFYNVVDDQVVFVSKEASRSTASNAPITPALEEAEDVDPFGFSKVFKMTSESGEPSPLSGILDVVLNNPNFLKTIMDSNEDLRELRERNPDINHLLNDPQVLRQSVEMMMNPSLMREMMRSTDRALSNFEAVPGGFNVLRRMYHNFQEPMWNAAIEGSFQGKPSPNQESTNNYNLGTDLPPNNEALPNPWATNKPSPPSPPHIPPCPSFGSSLPFLNFARSQASNDDASSAAIRAEFPGLTDRTLYKERLNPFSEIDSATNNASSRNAESLPPAHVSTFVPDSSLLQPEVMANFPSQPIEQAANLEVTFSVQLSALRDMGFDDTPACIRALQLSNGNMNRALDRLLNPPDNDPIL